MSKELFNKILKIASLNLKKQKELEELSDFWIKSPPPDLDSEPFGEPRSDEWRGSDTDDEICENDSDCPNCKVCNDSNSCVLSGGCSNSADCPTGQICEDCSCVDDPCEPGGTANDCRVDVNKKHGTPNEIRGERDECKNGVGTNHCGTDDFCSIQQKLCNCDKNYYRHLCERRKALARCKHDNGCEMDGSEQDDLNRDCNDPSIWNTKKPCKDAAALCDPYSTDGKRCALTQPIITKICGAAREEALKATFEACYGNAAKIDDKDDRACAVCACATPFVNALKNSKTKECDDILSAQCPAGNESRRMKAHTRCKNVISNPTTGKGWFDKCADMDTCTPPSKPPHWRLVKSSCASCKASGGGTGGGHRPDVVRPPRPTTTPIRPRPSG